MRRLVPRAVALAAAASLWACCSGAPPIRPRGADAPVSPRAPSATVRVSFLDAPVSDARVTWRRTLSAGESPAAAAATDFAGKAAFDLAPGRYFVAAEWRADGDYARPVAAGDRFAYFGGNPVFIGSGGPQRELLLSLERFDAPRPGPPAPGVLSGAGGFVVSGGAPVAGAFVSAYLKPEGGFRDMGFAASAPSGVDGGYVLDLPPGRYYLVARKRAAGGVAGPLRKGDFFGYYAANPVTVAPGRVARADIPVTTIRLRNAPAYSGDSAAAAYVEGRIVGRDGKPRAGVYAALYTNPDLLNRPLFMSDVTGPGGGYRLPVPAPGTYYLGARSGYGGSPAPGDLYGRFEGSADHSLTVRAGDRLTGVDIVVEEVR